MSDTLTSGLSPVDEDLVQQAARDFENLAAVQKLFDDLTAANAAVQDFLGHYTAYLRAHAKFQLDRVQARADAAAGHAETIIAAVATYRGAVEAERQAETERNARRDEGETLQGRLAGLKNSEEYKAQGRIEDKRREMLAGVARGGGPAQPARPGSPRARRGRGGSPQADPPRRRGQERRRPVRPRAGRRRAAVRRRRRRLRPGRCRRRPAAGGPGAGRRPPRRRRRDPQAAAGDQGRQRPNAVSAEQDLGDQQTAEQAQEQAAAAAAARLASGPSDGRGRTSRLDRPLVRPRWRSLGHLRAAARS